MNHYFTNNENLESKLRILTYNYKDVTLEFFSDLGVFSKERIDYGSRLLLENFLKNNKKDSLKALDVGSGYGFLGISLAKFLSASVDMIDINQRAIHLAEKNIKQNKVSANVFLSDLYENVNDVYDVIITNPPIRAGKEIVLKILVEAKEYLNSDGEVWFVIRKDHGAKSVIKHIENVYKCQVIEKSKGFFVICAKKR